MKRVIKNRMRVRSMAFVSRLTKKGRPFVRFRETDSGAASGYIPKSVPLREMRIDIQIDEEKKAIRIGKSEVGVSCSRHGCFACAYLIFSIVGPKRIELSDGGDGWWYGSFDN